MNYVIIETVQMYFQKKQKNLNKINTHTELTTLGVGKVLGYLKGLE